MDYERKRVQNFTAKWKLENEEQKVEDAVKVIKYVIANKKDLNQKEAKNNRIVTQDDIDKLIDLKMDDYKEISCFTNYKLQEMFAKLLVEMYQNLNKGKPIL
jgi:hypothetical protein